MNSIILKFILINILYIIIYVIIKSTKTNNKILYFRDIPNIPSPLISYYDKGKLDDKSIYLTLLDLISKKYYKIENNKLKWCKNNYFSYDKTNLYSYEILLINFINSILVKDKEIPIEHLEEYLKTNMTYAKKIDKFWNQLKYEIRSNLGCVNKFKNNFLVFLITLIYFVIIYGLSTAGDLIIFSAYISILFPLCYSLYNFRLTFLNVFATIVLVGLDIILAMIMAPYMFIFNLNILSNLILFFNPILILLNIGFLEIDIYSKNQKKVINEIKGLKKFLRDFTNMDKKSLEYINLFEKYYAVSVALDIKIENPYNFKIQDDSLDTLTSFETLKYISDNLI